MTQIRPLAEHDRDWAHATLRNGWGSTEVARLGELIDAAGLPGLVAERDGKLVGLATYAVRPDGLEVVTIQASPAGHGTGRLLMDELRVVARSACAERIWLTTTNDNVRALDFYQRWGMDLVDVVLGGVDASRRVKPGIPAIGVGGVPMRHEFVLEFRFDVDGPDADERPGSGETDPRS